MEYILGRLTEIASYHLFNDHNDRFTNKTERHDYDDRGTLRKSY